MDRYLVQGWSKDGDGTLDTKSRTLALARLSARTMLGLGSDTVKATIYRLTDDDEVFVEDVTAE